MSIVYLNDSYMPMSEAKISPMDRGFLFGDGIYEVIPAYDGKLVGFGPHIDRMNQGLELIGIDFKWNHDQWRTVCEQLIEKKEFYEYAKIFDNYYGTSKNQVEELIQKNDVIFDIDWQGNKQLSNFKNLNIIKIFITTKNKNILKQRLLKRNQNSAAEVEKRLKAYDEDVNHWSDYDFVVINENIENCFRQIETIINIYKNTNYFFSNNSATL